MGKSRADEHQAFLNWLLEQIVAQQVDALIVAGDIFDTGAPPSYAREMLNQFVVDLNDSGCQFIILGGNHDSVATLNESKALLACLHTQVIASANYSSDNPEDAIIPLHKRHGKEDADVGAILCAVPFIRLRDVMTSQAGQSADDKKKSLQQAISDYYQTLYQQADKVRQTFEQDLPLIATGHLTTVGATTSDSVREIYIGTLDAFPASAFPPFDYIALGHIHKSQKVAKSDHIRYSGSPIPLSFDESKVKKSVLLLDFDGAQFKQAQAMEIPCFQPMQQVTGDLKSIETQLKGLSESAAHEQKTWVEITVSSQDYLPDLQPRIEQITEKLSIDVLRLRRERNSKSSYLQGIEKETLNELGVMDVFERRLAEEQWDNKADQARRKRIKQLFKKVLAEQEESPPAGEKTV